MLVSPTHLAAYKRVAGVQSVEPDRGGGVALAVPCSADHVVQVHLRKLLPPDGLAKHLANHGWQVGRRMICPDHSRKPVAAGAPPVVVETPPPPPAPSTEGPKRMGTIKEDCFAAVELLGSATAAQVHEQVGSNVSTVSGKLMELVNAGRLERYSVVNAGPGRGTVFRYKVADIHTIPPREQRAQPEEPAVVDTPPPPVETADQIEQLRELQRAVRRVNEIVAGLDGLVHIGVVEKKLRVTMVIE